MFVTLFVIAVGHEISKKFWFLRIYLFLGLHNFDISDHYFSLSQILSRRVFFVSHSEEEELMYLSVEFYARSTKPEIILINRELIELQ